jgi:two-component system phosphate regulon response regulator PhoB
VERRVVIIEDERDVARLLEFNLRGAGFVVASAATGAAGLDEVRRLRPDVVVLDLMLPDQSGYDVCKQIRADPAVGDAGVLMLTAKGEAEDRILGLEVGADDYVVKPYSVRELILRIRALLRRSHRVEGEPSLIRFGRLKIDRDAHRAWVDDAEIGLTALEFRLLHAFLSRRGRVQTRDALLSDVWGIEADVTTRTVDTHVKRLREKLGDAGAYIETLRGVGYRFKDQPDEATA